MNTTQLRALILAGNITVIALIGGLAYRIVKGSPFSAAETPRESFDPRDFEVKDTGGPRSSINEHRATWLQFDRPKPVIQPPPQTPPQPPPAPAVVGLATRYRLVLVNINTEGDDERNTAIVEARGGMQQSMVKINGQLGGFTVVKISSVDDGALLTVKNSSGTQDTIKLERK